MIAIRKNAREEIRVQRQNFKGHDLLSIRVFFKDNAGKSLPTKNGLSIRSELLPEFLAAIHTAMKSEAK